MEREGQSRVTLLVALTLSKFSTGIETEEFKLTDTKLMAEIRIVREPKWGELERVEKLQLTGGDSFLFFKCTIECRLSQSAADSATRRERAYTTTSAMEFRDLKSVEGRLNFSDVETLFEHFQGDSPQADWVALSSMFGKENIQEMTLDELTHFEYGQAWGYGPAVKLTHHKLKALGFGTRAIEFRFANGFTFPHGAADFSSFKYENFDVQKFTNRIWSNEIDMNTSPSERVDWDFVSIFFTQVSEKKPFPFAKSRFILTEPEGVAQEPVHYSTKLNCEEGTRYSDALVIVGSKGIAVWRKSVFSDIDCESIIEVYLVEDKDADALLSAISLESSIELRLWLLANPEERVPAILKEIRRKFTYSQFSLETEDVNGDKFHKSIDLEFSDNKLKIGLPFGVYKVVSAEKMVSFLSALEISSISEMIESMSSQPGFFYTFAKHDDDFAIFEDEPGTNQAFGYHG